MDDPPANTYTYEMMRQLDEAILKARFDDDVHVIVLRGEGEKFFCAGANIDMLKAVTPDFKYYFCLHANETLNRLEQTPKLVIAALNGHTVGGGLEIAMAADLRIARKDAGKIGLPEVALGVLPGTGGTQRLARLVGKAKAIELMVTGRPSPSRRRTTIGIVNQVWDATRRGVVGAGAWSTRSQFCPPQQGVEGGRAASSARCRPAAKCRSRAALALERELQQLLFQSEDAKEGIAAYVGEARSDSSRGSSSLKTRPLHQRRVRARRRAGGASRREPGHRGDDRRGRRGRHGGRGRAPSPPRAPRSTGRGRQIEAARSAAGCSEARRPADRAPTSSRGSRRWTTASRSSSRPRSTCPRRPSASHYFGGLGRQGLRRHVPGPRRRVPLHAARAGRRRRAITPWNFPLLQAMWKVAPALALRQHGRAQARVATRR